MGADFARCDVRETDAQTKFNNSARELSFGKLRQEITIAQAATIVLFARGLERNLAAQSVCLRRIGAALCRR